MRIAYVEDNPTNLALVERVAGMNHHVIVSYNEGEVAVKELLNEKFDLILMDVELAGELGGLQVVQQLRLNGLTTPIVAVTAYAMMGDRDKCLEAGCDDYLPKPLPIVELVAMLARYDEQARRIAAGEPVPERKVPIPVAEEMPATLVPPAIPVPSVPSTPHVLPIPSVVVDVTTTPAPTTSDIKPVAPTAPAASPTPKVDAQSAEPPKEPDLKAPAPVDKTLPNNPNVPNVPVEATATPENKQHSD